MNDEFLDQRQGRYQVPQVEHLDWRMGVTARKLDFKGDNTLSGQVRCCRISYAALCHRELVWHTCSLGCRNHGIAHRSREQKTMISRTGSWSNQYPLPDPRSIGQ